MSEFEQDQGLEGALVELTAPDGTVYKFQYAATIDYAQQDYVVLMEMEQDGEGNDQLLITRLNETQEGELSFEVVQEDDIISAVFEKYVAQSLADAMEEGEECACGHCHHGHGEQGCDCGHTH